MVLLLVCDFIHCFKRLVHGPLLVCDFIHGFKRLVHGPFTGM